LAFASSPFTIQAANSTRLIVPSSFRGAPAAKSAVSSSAEISREPAPLNFTDCPLLYGLVIKSLVQFIDLEKTPLPPPAFGFATISDLSPASIEKARAEALRDLEQHR